MGKVIAAAAFALAGVLVLALSGAYYTVPQGEEAIVLGDT